MNQRNSRGFTLVEMMIVVTIVGILAAVAIPTYQSYAIRSKISEALGMMGACKTAVTDYLAANAGLPPDLGASGCAGNAGTQYVAAIDVVSGVITVTMATRGDLGAASGGTVKLSPTVANNMITTGLLARFVRCNPDDVASGTLPLVVIALRTGFRARK